MFFDITFVISYDIIGKCTGTGSYPAMSWKTFGYIKKSCAFLNVSIQDHGKQEVYYDSVKFSDISTMFRELMVTS